MNNNTNTASDKTIYNNSIDAITILLMITVAIMMVIFMTITLTT